MKNIKIFTLLIISLTSINIYALSDDEQSYCFSTDPELGDSAYWASAAINFYNSGQHKKAISVVDNCFEYYAEDALYQQSQLKKAKISSPPIGRVDFRELIKRYAREFKTRIEMKQVGLREEASRLGGIGSCGRELCCSTWLNDLRKVNTSSARYQKLSINPQKLAGQCGKLKCCLNYELDTYLDALKDFPKKDFKIKTKKGIAVLQKTDIFKKRVWYAYKDNFMEWFEFDLKALNKMIAINKSDKEVSALEDYTIINSEEKSRLLEDSINRFDRKKRKKNV